MDQTLQEVYWVYFYYLEQCFLRVFNILSRKFSKKFSPMELTYAMMAMGAVFFNLVSVYNHIRSNTLNQYFTPLKNKNFLISLAYLGILSSIIAFFLTNFTLSRIEASKSAIFVNLSTIVSIIAGVVLLNEYWGRVS
ncbi:DMT family transporter [Clostridium bowmanii]|nr:DMT family transporter [Clostridium bowmanii]